jgi:hypothetical protein
MGKIFIVAVVVGMIWSGYALVQTWKRQFHAGETVQAKPVEVTPSSVEPTKVEPKRPQVEPAQEYVLRAQAWNHEWVFLEEWGMVVSGDTLPDGNKLVSWQQVGGWWVVLVQKGGELVKGRFERAVETAKRRAKEFMTNAPTMTATASPGGGVFGPPETP